jgi:hypothetical protein
MVESTEWLHKAGPVTEKKLRHLGVLSMEVVVVDMNTAQLSQEITGEVVEVGVVPVVIVEEPVELLYLQLQACLFCLELLFMDKQGVVDTILVLVVVAVEVVQVQLVKMPYMERLEMVAMEPLLR